MGFDNPPVPWRELERRLSGRPAPKKPAPTRPADDETDDGPKTRPRAAYEPPPKPQPPRGPVVPYGELHAHSSFSFLDGASSPEELAEEAVRLGLTSLTLTDHDGLYGIVRFAEAAKTLGLPTGFGAELTLGVPLPATKSARDVAARIGVPDPPGTHLLVLARDPDGYARLSRSIGRAHLTSGVKGRPQVDLDALADEAAGRWVVLTGCRKGAVRQALDSAGFGTFALDPARRVLADLVDRFGRENVVVELTHELDPLADERYDALALLASEQRLQLVATTNAHYHAPPRRPLATALAAVRARTDLDSIDGWLPAWAGQHLRSGAEMAARFTRFPGVVQRAHEIGAEITFPLALIAPKLPPFPLPPGFANEMAYLWHLVMEGAGERFNNKPHEDRAYEVLEHELTVIEKLEFPGYFLIVWDIVRFCNEQNILCQGRGSAANSAVCYALGITAVDAVDFNLMFERFLAPERGEPPDIDVDIESGRREEVIQYVYAKHGRERAAQVANVISYRPKSAVRDVARALGYAAGQQDAWSSRVERSYYWTTHTAGEGHEGGEQSTNDQLDDAPPLVVALAAELQKAPRHLGIHSGGMVMCDRPVIEVCPVEWARKENRTVLQWDKDDCAAAGLVKFDLLGLGMLTSLHNTIDLVAAHHGVAYTLDSIPKEAECVYDMLCAADSIGVFQVESRAQMATLPRLRPREFYDLAIQVALIRPGPIQGNSVHPFIRRHRGYEKVEYDHPLLEEPLRRTKGVPLFQEQLMQVAVAVAGFTPDEADQLRRAMGSKRSVEKVNALEGRLRKGMAKNGITGALAETIIDKIRAFASYGFAESHSISFALLVYASSWFKRHYPAAFCAAMLNAQPMGFYSPQSLVHDAKRHGIEVRPPSLDASGVDATLEPHRATALARSDSTYGNATYPCRSCAANPQPAVRMGLSSVRTIGRDLAERIVNERTTHGMFTSMADLSRRIGLSAAQMEALATSGALDCLGHRRREALWGAGAAATARPGQLELMVFDETAPPQLTEMDGIEEIIADVWATGVSTAVYPTAVIRDRLDAMGIIPTNRLRTMEHRTRVLIGGIVTHRQRPSTARGVTFLNIEDEHGMVNVICNETVWGKYRKAARTSGGLVIRGMLERSEDDVISVVAERIGRLNLGLKVKSRDFQ